MKRKKSGMRWSVTVLSKPQKVSVLFKCTIVDKTGRALPSLGSEAQSRWMDGDDELMGEEVTIARLRLSIGPGPSALAWI